jgi:hypothetical protein
MGDINNDHGDAMAATFPVLKYVYLVSYLAIVLVPYDVFSMLHVIKTASDFVMVIWVIKHMKNS